MATSLATSGASDRSDAGRLKPKATRNLRGEDDIDYTVYRIGVRALQSPVAVYIHESRHTVAATVARIETIQCTVPSEDTGR